MSDVRIEKFVMEDGRQAERHITMDGDKKVVEVHVEPTRPKNLAHRVVEKSANVVVKREIETIDETTGEVVDKKVESMDPADKMQLVDHIVAAPYLTAQSVEESNCYITKQDLEKMASEMASQTKEAILAATKVMAKYQEARDPKLSAMQIAVGEKVEAEKDNKNTTNWLLIGIALIAAGMAYVHFYM